MTITDRTRKMLWANSGNRCALCHNELVRDSSNNSTVIIGRECHIVSSKENGPRGKEELGYDDFDHYDNLILLCSNDHTEIDTLVDKYSVEKLREIKKRHDNWVKSALKTKHSASDDEVPPLMILKKIESGSELVKLIDSIHFFTLDNEDFHNEKEVEVIAAFLDLIKEYIEWNYFDLMNYTDIAKLGLEWSAELEKIDELGFTLFGIKFEVMFRKEKKSDPPMKSVVIIAARKNNPAIRCNKLLMKKPDSISIKW